MKIATLRKKARDGSLEVEDLLKAAVERQPGLREALEALAAELGWSMTGQGSDGTRVVPLAAWARVAGAYAEGGFAALEPLVHTRETAELVPGLLEEIRQPETLSFLLATYRPWMEGAPPTPESHALRFRLVSVLNQLLSFKPLVAIDEATRQTVQTFLLASFPHAATDSQTAHIMAALRGVGDEHAIAALTALPDLPPPWDAMRTIALKAIKKRQKSAR